MQSLKFYNDSQTVKDNLKWSLSGIKMGNLIAWTLSCAHTDYDDLRVWNSEIRMEVCRFAVQPQLHLPAELLRS